MNETMRRVAGVSPRATAARRRRLLCSLGLPRDGYQPVTYRLGERSCRTRFAPAAVARLLDLRGGSATVLATERAKEQWYGDLAEELSDAGLSPEVVVVSEGRTLDQIMAILSAVERSVREEDEIFLDVTYGFRHLPFVYLGALTYFTALKGISVGGIYYGAFEPHSQDGATPILEMTPLFRIIQGYHAVQSARDSGDHRPLARLVGEFTRSLAERSPAPDAEAALLRDIGRRLEDLGKCLAAGLPLESGVQARSVLDALNELSLSPPGEDRPRFAAVRMALMPLREYLIELACEAPVRAKRNCSNADRT